MHGACGAAKGEVSCIYASSFCMHVLATFPFIYNGHFVFIITHTCTACMHACVVAWAATNPHKIVYKYSAAAGSYSACVYMHVVMYV